MKTINADQLVSQINAKPAEYRADKWQLIRGEFSGFIQTVEPFGGFTRTLAKFDPLASNMAIARGMVAEHNAPRNAAARQSCLSDT